MKFSLLTNFLNSPLIIKVAVGVTAHRKPQAIFQLVSREPKMNSIQRTQGRE